MFPASLPAIRSLFSCGFQEFFHETLGKMRAFLCITFLCLTSHSNCLWAFDELLLRDVQNSEEKLLVMTNGRVVSGQLTPRAGGYDVVLPAGRMFVPSKQIRFQADSMDDAYQRMRATLQELTPNTHLDLARWCLANNLQSYARREALDALHLDPHRTDAQRMLESLVRENNRSQHVLTPQMSSEQFQRGQVEQTVAPERRSLGGLPADRAKEFTQRIQPLMTNKCGNARCHGAGRNSFSLVSLRRSATSVASEQNLAAVLNQLDFQNPDQSPLLQATQGLHGGNHQPLFPGQSGGRQVDTLREWVRAVAAELAPTEPAALQNIDENKPVEQTSFRTLPDDSGVKKSLAISNVDEPDAAGQSSGMAPTFNLDGKFIRDAVVATRYDEFDPDVFNLRYHGRRRSEMLTGLQQSGTNTRPGLGTP